MYLKLLKRTNGQGQRFAVIHGDWPAFGWIVRDFKETRLKSGGKISGKEIRTSLLKCAGYVSMRICKFSEYIMSDCEKPLNNQMGNLNILEYQSVLFKRLTNNCPYRQEVRLHIGSEIWTSMYLVTSSEPPDIVVLLWETSQLLGGMLITLDCFYQREQ